MLLALLSECDSSATNSVSLDTFRKCLSEMNAELEPRGFNPLSDAQMRVICEIASAGADDVKYDHFLRSLHVEDTHQHGPSDHAENHSAGGFDIRMLPKGQEAQTARSFF